MRKKKGKGQASSTRYPRDEQRRRVERWPCPIIGLEKPEEKEKILYIDKGTDRITLNMEYAQGSK